MNWYVIAALVLAASFATLDARAEFLSGNDLHRHCTSTDRASQGICNGFIIGVYDTRVNLDFCSPEGDTAVTVGQVGDIVKKHLNFFPEQRHKLAYLLVTDALVAAFPCPRAK
jgi:hypothetical protein